jgi:hypothetical protein
MNLKQNQALPGTRLRVSLSLGALGDFTASQAI